MHRRRATDRQYLIRHVPKHIYVGILIAFMLWGWFGFKHIESSIMPVVKDFKITEVKRTTDRLLISGEFDKVRDCKFKELIPYSNGVLIYVDFLETFEPVNRVPGHQYFGWWSVIPPVKKIEIYARHQCSTGVVTTKVFDGVIE